MPSEKKKRINSRAKGCRIEREASKFLTSIGFPAERAARNGVRDGQDIICESLTNVIIECKGDEQIDLGTKALWAALRQAMNVARGRKPCVLWKRKHSCWRLSFVLPNVDAMATVAGDDDVRGALIFLNTIRPLSVQSAASAEART